MTRQKTSPRCRLKVSTFAFPAWFCLLSLLAHCNLHALVRNDSFQTLYHTAWTVRDGAPANIHAIAQTSDGYLWLATEGGLYRFDGVQFERFQPASGPPLPSGAVTALLAVPDGGLWIGYIYGGLTELKSDKATNYGEGSGLGTERVEAFARDDDGVIWAATDAGLQRFDGSGWIKIGPDWGYSAAGVDTLHTDAQGTVWVSSGNTLLYLTRGTKRFQPTGIRFRNEVAMAHGPDGTLWTSGIGGRVIPFQLSSSQQFSTGVPIDFRSLTILVDREKTLWIGTTDEGIRRITTPHFSAAPQVVHINNSIDSFTTRDGLTSGECVAMLEDLEGNVWVATTRGLDRFRQAKLTTVTMPSGSNALAVATGDKGAVLVTTGAVRPGILEVNSNGTQAVKGAPNFLSSAYRDQSGTYWFGARGGIWKFSDKHFERIPLPKSTEIAALSEVRTIVRSRAGDLWVSVIGGGLLRYSRRVWEEYGGLDGLPHSAPLVSFCDSSDRLWFGYMGDLLVTLKGDRVQVFTQTQGLNVGNVTAITEGDGALWIGGTLGMQRFDQRGFVSLASSDGEIKAVSGIAIRANGELWFSESAGLSRIKSEELAAFEQDSSHKIRFDLFDVLDGMPGAPLSSYRLPSLVQTSDGRIWSTTRSSLVSLNPDNIPKNLVLPSVAVTSIDIDGVVSRNFSSLKVPQRPQNITINYTALSLSMPERVNFRYQLEGFDKDWQQAGTRRQAFYPQLPPGSYKFHVIACNNDDIWNNSGYTLVLAVPPSFTQTVWFTVLCCLTGLALAWLLYQARLRQVTVEVRSRMQERLAERERIARELHDTFFQSIQGLLLRFNTGTARLNKDDPARAVFIEALEKSDQVMKDGRELVLDLRACSTKADSLVEAFTQMAEEYQQLHAATFKVMVNGEPRSIVPETAGQLIRVGREALYNAFQHSNAKLVEVELNYDASLFKMRFRDDGSGIDPSVLAAGHRPGHYGLIGMRERSVQLGATTNIYSKVDGGTEVEVTIPARKAYQVHSVSWLAKLSLVFGISGDYANDKPKPDQSSDRR